MLTKVAALAALAALAAASSQLAAQAADRAIAIEQVTVIPMTGAPSRSAQTILIRSGRIEAVGPSTDVQVPSDAVRLDGRGKFVIPGLWDMHVHTSREGRARYFWPLFLAHGVTGVREMGSFLDTLRFWRDELRRRPDSGPRIIWSSPMLDGAPAAWTHGIPLATPQAARQMVDSMHALGFDFIKVYERLPREVHAAIADQARKIGMPFAGHVPRRTTAAEASAAGQRSIEHLSGIYESCIPELEAPRGKAGLQRFRALMLNGYDAAVCARLFAVFRANQTWQTPTLSVIRGDIHSGDSTMRVDPRRAYMPAQLTARWVEDAAARLADEGGEAIEFDKAMYRRLVRLTGAMHRAGVRILVGTDASDEPNVYPGSSVHDEMEFLVEAGLTPAEALAAATVGPAEFLGLRDSLGTIEPNRAADLVVLDADPLTDIRNVRRIHAVVSQGRLIDANARSALLERARIEAARAIPSPPAAR